MNFSSLNDIDFEYLSTQEDLSNFVLENKGIEWMCFDTEFIGERRYETLLCLIQIATEHGFYLLDPLTVPNLKPFYQLIEDERILKITHAGENDYRLLYNLFGVVPQNVFDAQIAAAFAGYKYPVSFGRLVENELRIRPRKGMAVTDWERRPIGNKQLFYALQDVVYLRDLWASLTRKLEKNKRLAWAKDEFTYLESEDYYFQDPNREALKSNMIRNLKLPEQVFLIRLFAWRDEEAKRLDYSKEMILPSKLFNLIIRSISEGKDAMRMNRRIPDKTVKKYGDTFMKLYAAPPTPEELEVIQQIPKEENDDPRHEILIEMLYLIVRYRCMEADISYNMVLPRTILKRLKSDVEYVEPLLKKGWRRDFLGKELCDWLSDSRLLELEFLEGQVRIGMKEN